MNENPIIEYDVCGKQYSYSELCATMNGYCCDSCFEDYLYCFPIEDEDYE